MRTSLNDLKHNEDFLQNRLPAEESLFFQARLIVDPVLRANVSIQKMLYSVVRDFGRRKTKAEIEQIHHELFSDPSKKEFQERIYREFKKQ
jgi:hypothetical protein